MAKYRFNIKKIKEEKKLGFLYHEIFKKIVEFSRKYPKLTFTILPNVEITPQKAFALGALYMAIFLLGNDKKEISDEDIHKMSEFLERMETNVMLYEMVNEGYVDIVVKNGNFAFVVTEKGKKRVERIVENEEVFEVIQILSAIMLGMLKSLKDDKRVRKISSEIIKQKKTVMNMNF
jgi:hypothetical protein